MNWKQRLFKPKWQHKNADIRLAAVANEQHPQLLQSLAEIAGLDEDARVRCAAIRRMHDLKRILELARNETDDGAKSLLQERIRQLSTSTGDKRPALELRLQVAETTADRDLLERLAAHAPESGLRRAALARVTRQGFLGDCCIGDDDAENRRLAASRITQLTTMKRVIDGLRKRDKVLYVEMQARVHQQLLEQADPEAVHTEALKICTGLEKLVIEPDRKDSDETRVLHTAWKRVAPLVTNEMSERYQRVCNRLAEPRPSAPAPVAAPETAVPVDEPMPPTAPLAPIDVIEQPEANPALRRAVEAIEGYQAENTAHPKAASIKQLTASLDKAWQQLKSPNTADEALRANAGEILQKLAVKLEEQQQQREKNLHKAEEMLAKLQQELDDGALQKALATRAGLQQLSKGKGRQKAWQQIHNRMAGLQGRLRELRDWHHWSNNKIRKRLITEMELLPAASDLHPDALLDRIKSLQAEWKVLEESEQIPGDKHFAAAPWMWRKFSAAGHIAFDTARPFLDKRSEIQSREAQSLATFCAELKQLADTQPTDWVALAKGLTRGRKKLQGINNLPAKQRQKLARQLKSALDTANAVMQGHYEQIEKEKMKLIRSASQLVHLPERDEAITQAKALQAQWKAAGSLWRSREQALWIQFREHLDPLFEQLKEQQASIRAAAEEKLASQKALCDELQTILEFGDDLPAQHGRVQGLQDRWRDVRHPDGKLLQSFQGMVTDYEQQVEGIQQQKFIADRDRWWLKSGLLHRLVAGGKTADNKTLLAVQKDWPGDSSSDEPIERSMDKHYRDILDGQVSASADNDIPDLENRARALCIRLEFVAGLPSPDDEREQRMQYQVDRLAESMSGEAPRQPALDEAHDAEKRWLGMYALPEAAYTAYGKRVKQALAAIIIIK